LALNREPESVGCDGLENVGIRPAKADLALLRLDVDIQLFGGISRNTAAIDCRFL